MSNSILNVVDFDETLFRVPGFTSANLTYEKPYDWFDSPESLNLDKHRIQLIESVNSKLETKSTNIVLSHRVAKLKPELLLLMHKFNLTPKFNDVILCERSISKPERLIRYLKESEAKGILFKTIKIFEDSLVQLDAYLKNQELANLPYSFEYWFVDKTELLKIGKFNIEERERIQLKYL
jgi:hypothetical protein